MNGGCPAFPISALGFSQGMTLRDYFAAKALQGELASQASDTGEWLEGHYDDLSKRCYAIADAMLAERVK